MDVQCRSPLSYARRKVLRYIRCSPKPGATDFRPSKMIILVFTFVALLGPLAVVSKPSLDLELPQDRHICWVWDPRFCLFSSTCG